MNSVLFLGVISVLSFLAQTGVLADQTFSDVEALAVTVTDFESNDRYLLQTASDAVFPSSSKTLLCDQSCVPADVTNPNPKLPRFCDQLCPEYIAALKLLQPDALCERCLDASCLECRCTIGECLTTANCSHELCDICDARNGRCLQCLCKGKEGFCCDSCPEGNRCFLRAGPRDPVEDLECGKCKPKKICQYVWFC